jgi:hypothetical protein
MAIKYTKWPKYIPIGHKIYQHFPVRGPTKFTQIWIFGLKIYNLATLARIEAEPKLVLLKFFNHSQESEKQCDRTSSCKSRPKCSPTHFSSKLMRNPNRGKK